MANKTWEYVVTYQSPEHMHLTPAQREEEMCRVQATTAPRALSKAKKDILDDWEGVEAKDLVILDVCRAKKHFPSGS